MVAQLLGLGNDNSLAAAYGGSGSEAADRGLLERRGHVHILKVEGGDLLLFAVFEDMEIALFEPLDQLAGLRVSSYDIG